jgi:hypothetical protein
LAELLTIDAKQELIDRIANSSLFRKSPRLREFLLYTGDCTLGNRLEDVRQHVIAERVFQRKGEYYDLQDSIVRTEARNLRKRLEKYFETEGRNEGVLVTMPKGGYWLAFEPRSLELSSETIPSSILEIRTLTTLPNAEDPRLDGVVAIWQLRFVIVLCVCLGVTTAVSTLLAIHWYPRGASESDSTSSTTDTLPFSSLFDNRHDTFIVTSDTAFLKISDLEGRRLSLNDYLLRTYPEVPHLFPSNMIRNLNWVEFTDGAETKAAGLIMKKNAQRLQRTFLRSGRQVQLTDFKTRNSILLGSAVSNPWVELYANQLNFRFDFNPRQGITIVNRSPQRGELPVYPNAQDEEPNRRYAQLAFIPGTSPGDGNTLLLAGTSAEATGAAADFLLDDAAFAKTLNKIGIDPKGPPRYWELLLRATTFVGGATHPEVIGYRVRP